MKVARFIAMLMLVLGLVAGVAGCKGDEGTGSDSAAVSEQEGSTEATTAGGTETEVEGAGEDDADGPARSEQIDELLTLHPVFATKRFMNFAARGNPGACSLLSAKGRKAIRAAHGRPCEDTIRAAAAEREEPGLVINGDFVAAEEFSDLEYRTTIYVFEREQGRISINGQRPPVRLSQYGRIWLIDAIPPFDEIST